ncbi:hypothetical protein HU200_001177 [Digitaria exilis]|uniref:Core-2/I-branching beta-1,6-N-acetylglucosaminyltransferase family protein n=1 Tax=Digitaria exilis TaxID=1010633 RepID=A0A835KV11_9POAL|nr:hypothetical protein HU200_001177 [Digitaria exilis]
MVCIANQIGLESLESPKLAHPALTVPTGPRPSRNSPSPFHSPAPNSAASLARQQASFEQSVVANRISRRHQIPIPISQIIPVSRSVSSSPRMGRKRAGERGRAREVTAPSEAAADVSRYRVPKLLPPFHSTNAVSYAVATIPAAACAIATSTPAAYAIPTIASSYRIAAPTTPTSGGDALLPANSVMHNMTDEELFWWASMAPRVRNTPYHRVPKVAFLFLTRGNLPLWPLWETFFTGYDGMYSIYVHTDPSYTGSPPKESAERRLLANALLDLTNERFALLSESCIPLYNFTTVHTLLTGSSTSFVDSFVNHDSQVRYNPFFADHANISLAQWRKGFQFFEMDRALALEVISNDTYLPAFRDYCAAVPGCLMDEHYIPTLLSLVGWKHNANRTLTFADWRMGGDSDVTGALIREIRGGAAKTALTRGANGTCYLFARSWPDP